MWYGYEVVRRQKNMKKISVTISFDEEKTTAARMYLKQKNLKLEDELGKALDVIYTKNVPSGVREFIDMRNGATVDETSQK